MKKLTFGKTSQIWLKSFNALIRWFFGRLKHYYKLLTENKPNQSKRNS